MSDSQQFRVTNYLLKIHGLFAFNSRQRSFLTHQSKFSKVAIGPDEPDAKSSAAFKRLKDQYYPSFRKYLTSEQPEGMDDFVLMATNPAAYLRSDEEMNGLWSEEEPDSKLLTCTEGGRTFYISNVELALFREGLGVFSVEVRLAQKALTLQEFGKFCSQIRQFDLSIKEGEKEWTWLDYLSQNVINDRGSRLSIGKVQLDNDSEVDEFSGSKFKLYQVVELEEQELKSQYDEILFELATSIPIGSVSQYENSMTPSSAYFTELMREANSVFNNWKSICLLDTYTTVGYGLFDGYGYDKFNAVYSRIYIYNIYFKYFLFYINSKPIEAGHLKHQRSEFNDFLNRYDLHFISYNFLPNRIHEYIRKGLNTDEEAVKLQYKISAINEQIAEKLNGRMNIILMLLAFLAIVPVSLNGIISESPHFQLYNWTFIVLKILIVPAFLWWKLGKGFLR